jgi:hypothetical protein
VGSGISPILKVGSVGKCADVETVILDIEVDGAARSVMGPIEIDGCEIRVWFWDSSPRETTRSQIVAKGGWGGT